MPITNPFEKGNPGRPKGIPNKIPAKIRAACLKECPETIEELKRLRCDPNPAIRLAACKELLDRGIGKAAQPIVGADEGACSDREIAGRGQAAEGNRANPGD